MNPNVRELELKVREHKSSDIMLVVNDGKRIAVHLLPGKSMTSEQLIADIEKNGQQISEAAKGLLDVIPFDHNKPVSRGKSR